MAEKKYYSLPELPYGYGDLAPHMSEEQLKIHHDKHHMAYVKGANAVLEKLDRSRIEKTDLDMKATLKELSFQIGGHLLHSLFWGNLAPARLDARQAGKGGGAPAATLAKEIEKEFGSFERFKKEFSQAAAGVEGSGWAALAYCPLTKRLMIMQIEKHNANVYPMFNILMVIDVFEHAYYIDYKNERAKFIEAFWNIVNWAEINKRLENILK
ncbi:MAG: superoxide dismutase [bacterium]